LQKVYAPGDFTGLRLQTYTEKMWQPRPAPQPWDGLPFADPADREAYYHQTHRAFEAPKAKGGAKPKAGPSFVMKPEPAPYPELDAVRRQALANVNLYSLYSPEEAALHQRMALALCWPLARVEADPEGALQALKMQQVHAYLIEGKKTAGALADAAIASVAHDQIPHIATMERAFDLGKAGRPWEALGEARDATVDLVGQIETTLTNPLRRLAGWAPVTYADHPWSQDLNAGLEAGDHALHGFGAGLTDVGQKLDDAGLFVDDLVRHRVVQTTINLARNLAGKDSIALDAEDDPLHRALEHAKEGYRRWGDDLDPWHDKASSAGRLVGVVAGTLVLAAADPLGGAVAFGLTGLGEAAEKMQQQDAQAAARGEATFYGTGRGDLAVLANGGLQALIGLAGPAVGMLGRARFAAPFLEKLGQLTPAVIEDLSLFAAPLTARLGPRALALVSAARSVGRSAAVGAAWSASSTLAANLAEKIYRPDRHLTDGVAEAAASGAVFGAAAHTVALAGVIGGRLAAGAGVKALAAASELRMAVAASLEAKAQAQVFERLRKAVAEQPLLRRAPHALESILTRLSGAGRVFAPVRSVVAAVERLGLGERERAALLDHTGLREPLAAVDAAKASGDPVAAKAAEEGHFAFPAAHYLMWVGGSRLHAELAPDLSFSPGGLSLRDAGAIDTAFRHIDPADAPAVHALLETPPGEAEMALSDRYHEEVLNGRSPEEALEAAEGGNEPRGQSEGEPPMGDQAPSAATAPMERNGKPAPEPHHEALTANAGFDKSTPELPSGPESEGEPVLADRGRPEQRLIKGTDEHGDYYDIVLYHNAKWSAYEVERATAKARALNDGKTFVTKASRARGSAKALAKKAGKVIPLGHDADHTFDLQLGGPHTADNISDLPTSVNRSLGPQIRHLIKDLPEGTRIRNVTIKHRPSNSRR
jgi:hypothetical protein